MDIHGKPCSREEVAAGLGFVDVEALDRWDRWCDLEKDKLIEILISEVANLRSEMTRLRAEIVTVSDRLAATGNELLD